MDSIPILVNQSLFLGTTPAFDLMFMDERFVIRFRFAHPRPASLDGAYMYKRSG